MSYNNTMKKVNYYLLAGLLALLLLSIGVSQLLTRGQEEGALRLEILQDGVLTDTITLTEGRSARFKVYSQEGKYNLIEIEQKSVRVEAAECRNQICVHTGWISQPGQMIVCAPNKLVLLIKGKGGEVDAIAY